MSDPIDLSELCLLPTLEVARRLLGCLLHRSFEGERLAGRIVETEAYLSGDAASHAFGGRTDRNATMFCQPARAYVYRIHQSYCLNVVTAAEGVGEAVLIRALEPISGVEVMRRLRRRSARRELTTGPGKLCQAMAIDLRLDGAALTGPDLILETPGRPPARIATTSRVGVSRNADAQYRFVDAESAFLSRPLSR